LLNLSGAHGPLFTRNLVILKDSAGHTGAGESPGLGIDLAMAEVEKASRLYTSMGLGARDDAQAMQHLIPGWQFDPKRPCLVR